MSRDRNKRRRLSTQLIAIVNHPNGKLMTTLLKAKQHVGRGKASIIDGVLHWHRFIREIGAHERTPRVVVIETDPVQHDGIVGELRYQRSDGYSAVQLETGKDKRSAKH